MRDQGSQALCSVMNSSSMSGVLGTSGSAHSASSCPASQSKAGPGAGRGHLKWMRKSPQGDPEPWGWMMWSEVLFSSEAGLNLSGFLMHEFLVFKLSKSLNQCGF